MKSLVAFAFREIVGRTVLVCILATFFTHLLLILNPVVPAKASVNRLAGAASRSREEERLRQHLEADVHAYWLRSEESTVLHRTQGVWRHLMARDLAEAARRDPALVLPEGALRQEGFFSYFTWLGRVVRGDLGHIAQGQDMRSELLARLPTTFGIALVSLLMTVLVAVYAAVFHALRPESALARTQDFLFYTVSSLPAFIVGYAFLRLFRVGGVGSQNELWPILTLVLSNSVLAELLSTMKHGLQSASEKNYVVFARSKGLTDWEILRRHVARNVLNDVLPRVGQKMAFVVSGTIVVEKVFSLNGLADMLIDGLGSHDNGRVLIVILVATVLVRIGSILADSLVYALNPKFAQQAEV